MLSLKDFINLNFNSHLRNIFCSSLIDEELKDIKYTFHGKKRKQGYIDLNKETFTENNGLSEQDIKILINKADNQLIENCEINDWDKIKQVITIYEIKNNILKFVTFNILNFNKDTSIYDIRVITCNEYHNKKEYFPKNKTGVVYEKKGNYIKRIQ